MRSSIPVPLNSALAKFYISSFFQKKPPYSDDLIKFFCDNNIKYGDLKRYLKDISMFNAKIKKEYMSLIKKINNNDDIFDCKKEVGATKKKVGASPVVQKKVGAKKNSPVKPYMSRKDKKILEQLQKKTRMF